MSFLYFSCLFNVSESRVTLRFKRSGLVPAIRGRFGPTAIPISTAALGRVGKDKLAKELGRRSVFGFSAAVRRLIEVNLISGGFFGFFSPSAACV